MERSFEDNLRRHKVNKKTIKALRKESITNATTLALLCDSDLNQLCAKHKISDEMVVLLKQIVREAKSGMVDSNETPSLDRYMCVVFTSSYIIASHHYICLSGIYL